MTEKLNGWDAEQAARIIEELFADLTELRNARQFSHHGMRTDIPTARVTLLNILSIATEGDLMGEDETLTEESAKALFLSLHTNEPLGYERGDCHCDHCAYGVDELVQFFGIQKPPSGVYSPSGLVRAAAIEKGWVGAHG